MKRIKQHFIVGENEKLKVGIFALGMMICMMLGILSGCSYEGRTSHLQKELKADKEYATYYYEQITDALEAKDKEVIKSLFSTYAIENTPQLDEQIEKLIDFYPGCNGGYKVNVSTSERSAYAGKRYIIYAKYTIMNDDKSYQIMVTSYIENAKDTDKVGVHIIQVMTEEEKTAGFKWKEEEAAPGIYVLE